MKTAVVVVFAVLSWMFPTVLCDGSRPLGNFIANLPHNKLTSDIDNIDIMGYLVGLITLAGPGLAIGILSLFAGIIYGLVRLCCCLCCSSSDDEDTKNDYAEDGESPPEKKSRKTFGLYKRLVPSCVLVACLCWILAACAIGWSSNTKFTGGVTDISTSVVTMGEKAVGLGDTLINALVDIADDIPASIDKMLEQISGLPDIATRVTQLGQNVNSTNADIDEIERKVKAINVSLPILSNLDQELAGITETSSDVIGNVTELTSQIADKLNGVLDSTLKNLNSSIAGVLSDVDAIVADSHDFVNSAKDMVHNVDGYIVQVRGYNAQRESGVTAMYAVCLVTSCICIIGWFIKKAFPFYISSGFGFVFSFLFWLAASAHLILGIVLSDVCPIIDPVVHSLIPSDGQAAAAINGCMGDTSLFESLNLTSAFNLSDYFDYQSDFGTFTNFVSDFNFSTIDNYLTSIDNLYTYNLTREADNITVATLGWNQTNVYTGLDILNNQTETFGHHFSLQNYTKLNLTDYPPDAQDNINKTRYALDDLVYINKTIYEQVDTVKAQMYDVQHSIDTVLGKIGGYSDQFHDLQDNVTTLATVNVTNALNIITAMGDKITNFFTLGDCSFVGTTYRTILNALCNAMEPAIELLAASQYMIGLGCITLIVLTEVLARRIPYPDTNRINNLYYNDDDEQQPGAVSMGVRSDDQPPPYDEGHNHQQHTN